MIPFLSPNKLPYLLLLLCTSLTYSACAEHNDTTTHTSSQPLETEAPQLIREHAVLSLNADVTPQVYDTLLDTLREYDVTPLVGLPGNVILVTGKLEEFRADTLSLPATLHHQRTNGEWHPKVDTLAPWKQTLNPIEGQELLTPEDVANIQNSISQATDRALSLKVAQRFIQYHQNLPAFDPQDEGSFKDVVGNLPHELKKEQEQLHAQLQTQPEHAPFINTQIEWIDQQLENLSSSNGIQGNKFAREKIILTLFFPESTNTGNEDWTAAEVEQEISKAATSVSSIVSVAPVHTRLFFQFHIHPFGSSNNTITHEPTNGVNEAKWIRELLANVGVPGNLFGTYSRNQQYEEIVASSYNAAHASTVYIVRDEEEPKADFNDSARTGWPHAIPNGYMVMNNQRGAGTFAHEFMHTVNANDQYSGSGGLNACISDIIVGHDRTVWANAPSYATLGNHEDCNTHATKHRSLMIRSTLSTSGNTQLRPRLDWYTRAAIGWGNTIQVLARTTLTTNINGYFEPKAAIHVDGITRENAVGRASLFRYMPSYAGFSTWQRNCLIQGNDPTKVWFPQGTSITPFARCDSSFGIGETGPSGTRIEIDVPSPLYFSGHEGRVLEYTRTYEPAAPINMDCSLSPFWQDGHPTSALLTPMGCFVRDVPEDRHAFIYNNNYYLTYTDTCAQGSFDGANCFLHLDATNGHFTISSDKKRGYWINLNSTTTCDRGTFVQSIGYAAQCLIANASPNTNLFVWNANLYETPTPGCTLGNDDTRNCYLGSAPNGTTAKLDSNRFYYVH